MKYQPQILISLQNGCATEPWRQHMCEKDMHPFGHCPDWDPFSQLGSEPVSMQCLRHHVSIIHARADRSVSLVMQDTSVEKGILP